jgi:hypothetical protein
MIPEIVLEIMQYGQVICTIRNLEFPHAKEVYYFMSADEHQYTRLRVNGEAYTTAQAERFFGPPQTELPVLSKRGAEKRSTADWKRRKRDLRRRSG